MTTLELILTIICGVIAIVLIGHYLIKIAKNNYLSKVYSTIEEAMKEAEQSGATGEEKKAYVLAKVKTLCTELKIPYDFIATLVSKTVEGIVKGYNSMTK